MEPDLSQKEPIRPATTEPAQTTPEPAAATLPQLAPGPRPPITQFDHAPRHQKRLIMIVTLIIVVILVAIAVGFYLGNSAPKHI